MEIDHQIERFDQQGDMLEMTKNTISMKKPKEEDFERLKQALCTDLDEQGDDKCLFMRTFDFSDSNQGKDYILVAVNTTNHKLLIAASNEAMRDDFADMLQKRLRIQHPAKIKPLTAFLNMAITSHPDDPVALNQTRFIEQVCADLNLEEQWLSHLDEDSRAARPVEEEMHEDDPDLPLRGEQFRQTLAIAKFICMCTKPEITDNIWRLEEHVTLPTKQHRLNLLHVMKHIYDTKDETLVLRCEKPGPMTTARRQFNVDTHIHEAESRAQDESEEARNRMLDENMTNALRHRDEPDYTLVREIVLDMQITELKDRFEVIEWPTATARRRAREERAAGRVIH